MIKDIIRIKYADTLMPKSWVYEGGSKDDKIPIIFSVFLVLTENKRILVDAGCETMQGFAMRNFKSPMVVLEEIGYKTEEITDIVLTHAHHDHIECVKYFKNATVHIQCDEYEIGKKYLSENTDVLTFCDQKEIDEGVKAVKIGGHSIGSCVVECQKDGKTFVLCGDECYSFYNLINKVPTATTSSPQKSKMFIDKYSKSPYECLLCHEE